MLVFVARVPITGEVGFPIRSADHRTCRSCRSATSTTAAAALATASAGTSTTSTTGSARCAARRLAWGTRRAALARRGRRLTDKDLGKHYRRRETHHDR